MNAAHALQTHPATKVGALLSALPEGLRARVGRAREVDAKRREAARGDPPHRPRSSRSAARRGCRARLVELVGGRSGGRFSTLLALLAAATTAGEAAVLVDLGDGFAPAEGAAAGIELERLLWLRPHDLKGALAAAELAIGGGFPLVVLDLGLPPVRGRSYGEGAWLRLARAAQAQGTALLVAAPYRVSGPAATAVLRVARGRALWQGEAGAPRVLAGSNARLVLEKRRTGFHPQEDREEEENRVYEGRAEEMRLAVSDLPEPEQPRPFRLPHRPARRPSVAAPAAGWQAGLEPAPLLLPLRRAASA
jgi:hypothetical protein